MKSPNAAGRSSKPNVSSLDLAVCSVCDTILQPRFGKLSWRQQSSDSKQLDLRLFLKNIYRIGERVHLHLFPFMTNRQPPVDSAVPSSSPSWLGCLLVAAGSCTFTITAAFVKGEHGSVLGLMQGRFVVSWILAFFVVVVARKKRMPDLSFGGPVPLRSKLLLRGTLYWIQVASWWVAVRHIPIGDITAAAQAAPIVTSFLAKRFLAEELSRFFAAAAACALLGISLLSGGAQASGGGGHKDGSEIVGVSAFAVVRPGALQLRCAVVRIQRGCSSPIGLWRIMSALRSGFEPRWRQGQVVGGQAAANM
eukprot:TRINITY_DN39578_c0_g2_i2.p1 TRINITY_DN39578_c0_g2~~TRINITY_DN39578_c0_g2_i2.p1  ORF type:complete len:308 (-),score=5.77 TRINITY_DN39578_c0_g2_i2:214-1137(-)